ncbi:MAG: 30S ribosomal protein S6 [Cyanobium sp. MAG06]|nr:30S ribosomal protein S6 [Cyanobium sp. MAG06]
MTEIKETTTEAKVYEICYILSPNFDNDTVQEKINSLKQSVASYGASFISEEPPFLRDISYQMIRVVKNINKRFNTGYYGWVKLEIDPANVKAIDNLLKDDQEIIRYIIVQSDKENNIYIKDSTLDSELDNKEDIEEDMNIDTTTMSGEDDIMSESMLLDNDTDVSGIVEDNKDNTDDTANK